MKIMTKMKNDTLIVLEMESVKYFKIKKKCIKVIKIINYEKCFVGKYFVKYLTN